MDELSVLPSHRVPAHLARRFHQICLGVTSEILTREDLTPLLWGVLVAVLEEPGRTQRHFARRTGTDPVSLGQMIDFLEQQGLVVRTASPEDRRAHHVNPTSRARKLRERLRPVLLSAQDRLLKTLSRPEQELLIDLLTRVVESNGAYAKPGNGRRPPNRKTSQLGN
ncbi:MarR family transcriptional regulator [Bradyrhizobium sp. CNPSo 4010]|uniref:MarR family transcriptional regulator n=1 Tax=Bradyrhizobium agreste TaxID=2751811 RepID=A0ABS0PIP8_9BRAD|nr:MarR family transcriptional regulator [Bradyrhizobium agreste]MBH5396821.1 MarR family transcriptional regulator [Bradyrhizobium agreste]